MKRNKLAFLFIATTCMTLCTGCPKDNRTVLEKLRDCKDITKVRTVREFKDSNEAYELIFTVPLDWEDKTKGTFPLRVLLQVEDQSYKNLVVVTEGYNIDNYYYSYNDDDEISNIIDANVCHIEHRFFGESTPEDMSYLGTKYWEYLTIKNAAQDENYVIKTLRKVFKGKFAATGYSKCGETTNQLAYFYPKACDFYVPMVAPFCESISDGRYLDYMYNHAYESYYGVEEAKKVRKVFEDFEVKAIQYEESVIQCLIDDFEVDPIYKKYYTMYYEYSVMTNRIGYWQYNQNYHLFEELLDTIEWNEENGLDSTDIFVQTFFGVSAPKVSPAPEGDPMFPFYVMAIKEQGYLKATMDYIQGFINDRGLDFKTTTTNEELENPLKFFTLSYEQEDAIKEDRTEFEKMRNLYDVTNCKILSITAQEDPWNYVRMKDPDTPRKNVHTYVAPHQCHNLSIEAMDLEMHNEIVDILIEWSK